MNKTGILGGTFDPFHEGHLSIARAAMEECELDKIILLPAKMQPFKLGREMASEEDRVAMAELVALEHDNFCVSTIETDGDKISYTYKTLCALQEQYPHDKLYFIMGTDSFLSLDKWYKGKELLENFAFIIGERPGFDKSCEKEAAAEYSVKYKAEIQILHNEILDVSSTDIKEKIKKGQNISGLVPAVVERYIYEHGLYK